jgi:2-polyprenyl-3-methyl-5-hydroxy-6-metoxy-1,4-benzoquinol methylase
MTPAVSPTPPEVTDTADEAYTERLRRLNGARWKQLLDVQRLYRWNLRRLDPGRTLDVGCGIGRQLVALPAGSVGVDHNPHSIDYVRSLGLTGLTVDQFNESEFAKPSSYDSILVGHVLEHMTREQDVALLRDYLPYLRPGGKIIVLCPQEAGFASDATHVQFFDGAAISSILTELGLVVTHNGSFPFPRPAGKYFKYNEFVVVGQLPNTP